MTKMAEIMRDIEETFGKTEPEVARLCGSIIDFISRQERPDRLHLTFSILKDEAKPENDKALMLALQYLTGASAELLEMRFEFVDEDGEYHQLSNSDIAEARRSRVLWHPVTGELVPDFEDRVFVYFRPTKADPAMPVSEGRGW